MPIFGKSDTVFDCHIKGKDSQGASHSSKHIFTDVTCNYDYLKQYCNPLNRVKHANVVLDTFSANEWFDREVSPYIKEQFNFPLSLVPIFHEIIIYGNGDSVKRHTSKRRFSGHIGKVVINIKPEAGISFVFDSGKCWRTSSAGQWCYINLDEYHMIATSSEMSNTVTFVFDVKLDHITESTYNFNPNFEAYLREHARVEHICDNLRIIGPTGPGGRVRRVADYPSRVTTREYMIAVCISNTDVLHYPLVLTNFAGVFLSKTFSLGPKQFICGPEDQDAIISLIDKYKHILKSCGFANVNYDYGSGAITLKTNPPLKEIRSAECLCNGFTHERKRSRIPDLEAINCKWEYDVNMTTSVNRSSRIAFIVELSDRIFKDRDSIRCDLCNMQVLTNLKHCVKCDRCVAKDNKHCDECGKCIESFFRHCKECGKCVDRYCDVCKRM